jgi:Arc/MetJ-type ribon-helix-helix transcriptional regulator
MIDSTMKTINLPSDLEEEIELLVSSGMFHSFQAAVEELIRIGLASIRRGVSRSIPPEQIPHPEKPFIPDPSRDILKM